MSAVEGAWWVAGEVKTKGRIPSRQGVIRQSHVRGLVYADDQPRDSHGFAVFCCPEESVGDLVAESSAKTAYTRVPNVFGFAAPPDYRYVDNLAKAQLLSQVAGGKLGAVYVNTKSQMNKVRQLHLTGGYCEEVCT